MTARRRGVVLVCALIGTAAATTSAQAWQLPRVAHVGVGPLLMRAARLNVAGIPLVTALEELTRTSGVALAYSPSLLPHDWRVRCACGALNVAQALDTLLTGTRFSYREGDGEVIIAPRANPRSAHAEPRLVTGALGLISGAAASEPVPVGTAIEPVLVRTGAVAGTVTSSGGGVVASAVVTLRRTQLSSTTDVNGRYRISLPATGVVGGPDTLDVQRIGHSPAVVPLQLRSTELQLDVTLGLEAVSLERLVVTGTAGNLERRAQAATVGVINAADIVRSSPVAHTMELLRSRLPGISVTHSSGTTGAAARINIRGAASISLSNQPLVFLDGMRIDGGVRNQVNVSGSATVGQAPSALNDLNPDDIETIEVVKGPAAATLYGADASAGVIQIITKKGRVGSRSFSQELTLEHDRIEPNFTVPTNYARCTAAATLPTSTNPLCRGQAVGAVISDNPAQRIHAFRDGGFNAVRYNARGGGENYAYFGSFGIANEQGTTINNLLKQRTGRVNFTFAPTPALTIDAGYALSRTGYDLPRTDQDAYGYYIQSIMGSPLTVRDDGPDGTITGGLLYSNSSLESLSAITSRVTALRSQPSVQIRFAPRSWLTHRVTVGADLTQTQGLQLFPKNDYGWYPDRQSTWTVATSQDDDRSYTFDYLGNVRAQFGAGGALSTNLSFGSQYIHRVLDRLSGTGGDLITNSAHLLGNTATNTVTQGFGEARSLGLFLQEQLGWRDRLFVQLGLRADRNSAFGREVGTFFLPKGGISYVISDEPFWQNLASIVPTLRLRAAYGTTGRAPASGSSLHTYATAKFVTDAGQLELGVVPGSPGNENLRPERGTELELGFDASVLAQRVGAEVTFFNKRSLDLLVAMPIPPSSGFGVNPLGNIGEVVNRGIELLVRATPVNRRNVTWDVTLAGSTLHNEVVSLGTTGTFINNFRAFVPGHQIAVWWVHRIRSIDEANGRVIVSDTAEFSGNQLPTLEANLTTSVSLFRHLRAHALFVTKRGYHVMNMNQEYRDRSSRSSAAVVLPATDGGYSATERLRRLGPYVSETTGATVGAANVKEPYIQRGDHIRLQELAASVSLPGALVRHTGASAASLTVAGRNLALWANDYEGHDPEVLGVGAQTTGIHQFFNSDVFTTPPARRWSVRLNVQF